MELRLRPSRSPFTALGAGDGAAGGAAPETAAPLSWLDKERLQTSRAFGRSTVRPLVGRPPAGQSLRWTGEARDGFYVL